MEVLKFISSLFRKIIPPYAIILGAFYYLFAVIPQQLLQQHWIQIAQDIVNLSTNAVLGIRFNYIGFFVPLIISISIFISGIWIKQYKLNKKDIGLLFAFILFALFSALFEIVRVDQNGASLDAPLVIFAIILVSIFLYLKEYRTALLLSYPIGFACGLASDIISTGAFKVGVYGGFGFFDGDFVLPLAFLTATYIIYKQSRVKL